MQKIMLHNALDQTPQDKLSKTLHDISHCQLCAQQLTHTPRPVVAAHTKAKLLIIGQAPGTKVHASGIPWDDASGRRLRQWLNIDSNTFYDEEKISIVPMGFCYPGKGRSGDLPPRPECAPQWHELVLSQLPNIQLTLLIGQYAQRYYLKKSYPTLTENVQRWREHLPQYLALPHPSPRNQIWLKKNPWFEEDVVPALQQKIHHIL